MRRRFVEMLAVVIGVGLLVFYYLDRQPLSSMPVAVENPAPAVDVLPGPTTQSPVVALPGSNVFPPVVPAPVPAAADPVEDEVETMAAAQAAWETARDAVASVRSELEKLDVRFDEKDEELSRLESEGADPDAVEEEMLIFLDGIVEEYDELEGRLSAAEAAEREAADRLEALGGVRS